MISNLFCQKIKLFKNKKLIKKMDNNNQEDILQDEVEKLLLELKISEEKINAN